MSNKELERLKRKYEIQENLEIFSRKYKQVLDILVYISKGNADRDVLQKTKEIIYSLPGLEKEVSQNIFENTFEDADKCKEYLKNLLKIIENKFYEIIKNVRLNFQAYIFYLFLKLLLVFYFWCAKIGYGIKV